MLKLNNYWQLLYLVICVISLFTFQSVCFASNDTSFFLPNWLNIIFKGKHIYLANNNNARIIKPSCFTSVEDEQFGSFNLNSPLFHGATWAEVDISCKKYGFTANMDIIGEHRGISSGVYRTSDIIVYPRINIGYDSSFSLFKQNFDVGVSVGHYKNFRMHEGLIIYNMEVVGNHFYIKWKNFRLAYRKNGDLCSWLDLNIDDINDLTLSAEEIKLPFGFKADIGLSSTNLMLATNQRRDLNTFGSYSIGLYNDNFRLYMEYGQFSQKNSKIEISERSALLVGAKVDYKDNIFELNLVSEYREYGKYFNLALTDSSLLYVKTDYESTYSKCLYPLYLFERPFSQWGVFTDYQNQNVMGITLQVNAKVYFYDKFVLDGKLDWNYIKGTNENGFVYPFYTIGIGYEPFPGCSINYSRTNRAMNLYKNYPTIYLLDDSMMMLSMNFDFKL